MNSVCVRVLCGVALLLVAAAQARSTWDGVYTDAQATRGEAIYADRCASCHAPDLSGIDQAAPLAGADFVSEWNDQSVNDLFERIRISMPADKPGSLERQQVADLIAFVLQRNTFPEGARELPTTVDTLKTLRFLAKQPYRRNKRENIPFIAPP